MNERTALTDRIKRMMVENLMLQMTAADIADDQPLFGPASLGLDSVDALQLVVALDKNFGLKIPDPAAAKEILQSVNTIVATLQSKLPGLQESMRERRGLESSGRKSWTALPE
jgi:acyl carrier protein